MTFIFPSIGNVIIPIDELILFRGVGWNHQPEYEITPQTHQPTNHQFSSSEESLQKHEIQPAGAGLGAEWLECQGGTTRAEVGCFSCIYQQKVIE